MKQRWWCRNLFWNPLLNVMFRRLSILVSLSGSLAGTSVDAQTLFQEPVDTVSVSRYQRADLCVAATVRFRVASAFGKAFFDTMPRRITKETQKWPAEISRAAQECVARWAVEGAPLAEYLWLMELYLIAGREADALRLMQRRFAEDIPKHDSVYGLALDSILTMVYNRARPLDLGMLNSIMALYDRLPSQVNVATEAEQWYRKLVVNKIDMYNRLYKLGYQMGDTAVAFGAAQRVLGVVAQLADGGELKRGQMSLSLDAAIFLRYREVLDSLRVSRAGYLTLLDGMRQRVSTRHAWDIRIGRTVEPIQADFWFPKNPDSVWPPRGKVSLVLVLSNSCLGELIGANPDWACAPMYARARRLKAKYPELEITILTHTSGGFPGQAPPTPVEEANHLKWWLLDTNKMAATLAIETTPFIPLSDPDRRKIPNYGVMNFARDWAEGYVDEFEFIRRPRLIYLIDRDGVIIDFVANRMDQWDEQRLDDLVGILSQRRQADAR